MRLLSGRASGGARHLWALIPPGGDAGTTAARYSAWGQTPYPTSSGASAYAGVRPRRRCLTPMLGKRLGGKAPQAEDAG
jgi:hypothetical protein